MHCFIQLFLYGVQWILPLMRLSCWAVTLRCIDHKMDKAKTKQRREGEWCHLTCHSDSSTTQNRRIKSYQTPSKDFSSTKRRWQRPKVAPQPLLAMNSHLTGTQIKSERKKERKKAIFWSSDCLSLVVCFSQPSVGVELSSTASGSGSLQHKGGGMVAELLVLRILLGTIPSLDNRTGQKTENARKKESECVWCTEKASWWQRQASKHKCSSSSICVGSWKLFCLWAFSIWHHLTIFHQKCTRFHHVCPFSRFSYAAKYQLAASDCTQHRRSARAHIALRQPWRWMQFPNICLSGKQNDEISVWTNDFRSMFT